jgi:spore germination protein YaaH
MKRILHSLVAIAAVATVAIGTAPPASGDLAAPIAPSSADATHPWVMEQTADDLANAGPVGGPTLFSAVSSQVGNVVVPKAATIPPLQREVFGFAFGNASLGDPTYGYPAWSMNLLTTIAYFGLTTNWDGTFVQSGSGWTTWNSAALTAMVAAAHANHVRVILSVNLHDFSASSKSTMCAALHPTHRAVTVAATVAQITKMHVDGVNLDYEGTNTKCAYQIGTTIYGTDLRFEMASLAKEMRAALPTKYIAVDTYSGSAGDTAGFFDVKAMAPYVNSFFVMTYDMEYYNWAHAPLSCTKFCLGPTSPLTTYYYNDTHVMAQYVSAVGASKTILGVPYYGRKGCVAGYGPAAAPPNAYPVSGTVASDGYLDASQENGYYLNTNYHKGRDVHDLAGAERRDTWTSLASNCTREMYFDDAKSIARKYDLVNRDNLRGAGIFALQYGGGAQVLWDTIAAAFTHPYALGAVAASQTSTEYVVNATVYYSGTMSRFQFDSYDVTAGKGWFAENLAVAAVSGGTGTWTAALTVHGYPGHKYQYRVRASSLNGSVVSPWSAPVVTTVATTATNPLPYKGLYAVRRDGYLKPYSSPPVATWSYGASARAAHPIPVASSPSAGAVLYGNGVLVSYGLRHVYHVSKSWPGLDIARDFAFLPSGTGGYVLDEHGLLWAFAVDANPLPPPVHGNLLWLTKDMARKAVILPGGAGGYVLDNTGGVTPFAIGHNAVPSKPVLTMRWPGQNFARDFVLIPGSKSGYVLTAYGGLSPFTAPGETTPVVPAGSPYWAGKDVARGLFLLPASTATAPGGYIVDCAAGLISWGNAPAKAVSGIWSCPAVRGLTGG